MMASNSASERACEPSPNSFSRGRSASGHSEIGLRGILSPASSFCSWIRYAGLRLLSAQLCIVWFRIRCQLPFEAG